MDSDSRVERERPSAIDFSQMSTHCLRRLNKHFNLFDDSDKRYMPAKHTLSDVMTKHFHLITDDEMFDRQEELVIDRFFQSIVQHSRRRRRDVSLSVCLHYIFLSWSSQRWAELRQLNKPFRCECISSSSLFPRNGLCLLYDVY